MVLADEGEDQRADQDAQRQEQEDPGPFHPTGRETLVIVVVFVFIVIVIVVVRVLFQGTDEIGIDIVFVFTPCHKSSLRYLWYFPPELIWNAR